MERLLVGTESGLWRLRGEGLEPVEAFTARTVTALARWGPDLWAIVDGRSLWRGAEEGWREHAGLGDHPGTCLAPAADGLFVGTAEAHLLRLRGTSLEPVASFEAVEGRQDWHTPWGDPADVRSIAVALDGAVYVNVHVGGVVRSRDGGRSWTPTLDIEVDVHQVIAHPARPAHVLVAAYDGFGLSTDGGDTWRFETAGMHAHYARAVAVAGETALVSASTGPRGRRSALYRTALGDPAGFVRCDEGLPWLDDNIDTGCLAADGALAVLGTHDGRVYRSLDGGVRWALLAKGLPAVTAVTLG